MLYGMDKTCCKKAEVIFTTNVEFPTSKRFVNVVAITKLKVAIKIIANSLLPTITRVYYVVENVRKIIIPTALAAVANYLSQESSDEEPEKSVECNVLTSPKDIKVDVIFVHGLRGAQDKTWKQGMWRHGRHKIHRQQLTKRPSRQASLKRAIQKSIDQRSINERLMDHDSQTKAEQAQLWPLWLDKDCPGARVIALNYTTDPYLWRPIWIKKPNRTGMVERSVEMLEHLCKIGVGNHPIVWVGHSKGGLYIKQILLKCSTDTATLRIMKKSEAILFYSVPHQGSIMADIPLPLMSKSVELTEVQRNCKFVLELHEKFLALFDTDDFRPHVFSFIETSFTLMSFVYLKIVSFDSADPAIGDICGVPLDHREICKPAGRDCFLYKELVEIILSIYRNKQSVY